MRGVALEASRPLAPPAAGARRLPSLEHHVPRRRGLQRARSLARRMGRRSGRRRVPRPELPFLLPAALGTARGRLREPVAALLGALSRALRRRRAPRGRRSLPRVPGAGDGESALVPGAASGGAPEDLQFHFEHPGAAPLRSGAGERVLRVSFAVWLTGLSGSGKSAIARELLAQLHARGVDAAVLESDVLRTQLTPFPRYDERDRDFFYSMLSRLGELVVENDRPVLIDA